MKTRMDALRLGVLTFAVAAACIPALSYAQTANLIQNPSLETSGAGGSPANWTKTFWGSPTPTFTYPVAGNGSAKAAQITYNANSNGDARWQPTPVTVTPGSTYTYTESYKSNVATEVDVEFTKSNGTKSYGWVADVPSSSNAWRQLSASFVIPSGVTKVSVYHIIDKTGTLVVDDVSLTSGSTPPPPPPNTPALTFTANPTGITSGQSATLSWNATNVSSCTASGGWTGTKSLTGTASVSPTVTTTYTLSCTGAGGTVAKDAVVTVSAVPPPPPPPTGSTFSEGMVTISFDDSWLSQYTNALPVLQTAGLKGTFYLTTEPIQEGWDDFMTPNQVKDIATKGHEIAGHTVTHADLTTLSQARIRQEITNSRNYLQTLTGAVVSSLAYPYGSVSNTIKNLAKQVGYKSARGVDEESQNLRTTDKFDLKSSCIETSHTMAQIKAEIDKAKANKQWYVLCIHEVKNGGDQYTMTPARFEEIVNYIKQIGIKTVTVKEGVALMAN